MNFLKTFAIFLLLPVLAAVVATPFIYQKIKDTRISQRVFNDTRGKTKVDCDTGSNTTVILILGQSNSTNEGRGRYIPEGPVLNFNYIDGHCYLAQDPLLGASGTGGSFASRLGDKLVSLENSRQVILVPLSVGASFIDDWAPKGQLHERIFVLAEKLQQKDLIVTHILFHQGEADAGADTAWICDTMAAI